MSNDDVYAIMRRNREIELDRPTLAPLDPRYSDYDLLHEGNGQERCHNAPFRKSLIPDMTHIGDNRTSEQMLHNWAPAHNNVMKRTVEPRRKRQESEYWNDNSANYGYRQQAVRGFNDVIRATQYNCETHKCDSMGDTGMWNREPANGSDIYGLTHGFRNVPEAHTEPTNIVLSRTIMPENYRQQKVTGKMSQGTVARTPNQMPAFMPSSVARNMRDYSVVRPGLRSTLQSPMGIRETPISSTMMRRF